MRRIIKFFQFLFFGYLGLIASLASIAGLIVVFLNASWSIYFALAAFIVFLLIILLRIISVTNKFLLQKTKNGYNKFATYVRYSTQDGKHIRYELHKYIQCKSIIIDEHEHGFFWTGTNDPKITSDLQEFKEYIKTEPGKYDKAIFKFKKPLTYNEFCIVHIKMELDDSDEKSERMCSQKVTESVQLISFRIELRHLSENVDAKISRKKLNTEVETKPELVGHCSFDKTSRSYEYNLFYPDVGYNYTINW